jgi:gluconate:H+ symporter, GntP family
MWSIILLCLCVLFIVLATGKLKLHPFLALLLAAFAYGILCRQMSLEEVVQSINKGFGDTIGYIGIVILAGSVIGTFLEKSGGAWVLAQKILSWVGRKNVPLALSIVGSVVSIPVFCDSGFVILSPLAKSLARKSGIALGTATMALSLGLYATHTMVPPTPGPVAAAALLEADLGLVILFGLLVSICSLIAGWVFSVTVAARVQLPGEEGIETEIEPNLAPDLVSDAPSAGKALVPIVLPILLIVMRSLAQLPGRSWDQSSLAQGICFLGQPIVALLIGAFFAFGLPKKLPAQALSSAGWLGEALISAAGIIVITGCGGAFGKVLQNSNLSEVIQGYLGSDARLGIWLPFIVAAALKTAQGSSTVAIITTATMTAPLLTSLGLSEPTGRALAVVAIGAGSMVVSHANDSYFWVVTQLNGMTVQQGYRLQTLGTLVAGSVAAVVLWLISLVVI